MEDPARVSWWPSGSVCSTNIERNFGVEWQIVGAEPLLPEETGPRLSNLMDSAITSIRGSVTRGKRRHHHVLVRLTSGHLVERFPSPEGTNVAVPTTVQHLEIRVPSGARTRSETANGWKCRDSSKIR